MEKRKMTKAYVILFIIGIALLFVIIAAVKVWQQHIDNLHLVVEKEIKEAAKDCFLKEECQGEITLQELYDKEYLDIQIDPVTKENKDNSICLKYINGEVEFCKE